MPGTWPRSTSSIPWPIASRAIPQPSTLVWLPKEISLGQNVLRPALGLFADGGGDFKFLMGVQHVRHWVNPLGAQWRNQIQIGDESFLTTSFYQPLDVAQRTFVEPGLFVERLVEDLYNRRRADRDLPVHRPRRPHRLRLEHVAVCAIAPRLPVRPAQDPHRHGPGSVPADRRRRRGTRRSRRATIRATRPPLRPRASPRRFAMSTSTNRSAPTGTGTASKSASARRYRSAST